MDFEPMVVKGGCVYHVITPILRGYRSTFKVDVFLDGDMTGIDLDTGESFFEGGRHVATLFAPTEDAAHGVGIHYALLCSKKGA